MPIPRLSSTASGDEVAAALAAEGCAIVERAVPPALLDQARAELAPWLEVTPVGSDDFSGRRTRRTGGLIARSPTCRDLVMHPLVIGAVGKLWQTAVQNRTADIGNYVTQPERKGC